MIWLACVYLFMLIFRPFEYWPAFQDFFIERITLITLTLAVFFTKRKQWHATPLNAAVVALLLAFAITTATSDDPEKSFNYLYELIKFCLLYVLFQAILVTESDIINFVMGYVAIMGGYVGKSAWEFFVNGRHVYRMGISRMMGVDTTLGDPNAFAASIAYSLPFAVMLLRIQGLGKHVRMSVAGYIGLALVAVVFTGSRSGQMTCLLLAAMLLAISSRKVLYLSLAAILLTGSWMFMPEEYQQRFISTFDQDAGPANAAESANSRLELFQAAIDLFEESPVVGFGPGMFSSHSGLDMSPHNLLGQVLSENGLLGALTFLAFLVVLALESARCARSGKKTEGEEATQGLRPLLAMAGMQTIVLLLFNGIASHNFYRYNWLFVAAITAAARLQPRNGPVSKHARQTWLRGA